jgi:hypothetical protein
MVSVLSVVILALVGQARQDLDVLALKDGRTLRGLIEEETDEIVVLRIIVKGAKGETAVSGKVTVRREEIAEIRRIDDDARESEKAKAEAFEDREWEREKRISRIAVGRGQVAGRDGLVAAGDLFVVRTTCDEDFARAACDTLQQAYEGYLRHFKLRRKARVTLPVIVLDSPAAYHEYLQKTYGGTLPGSLGVYIKHDNVIITFNCVQREEATRIRGVIIEARKKIEDIRKDIIEHERKVDERARKRKGNVVKEAAEARAEVRRADPLNRPALMREIDDWVKGKFKEIEDWKAGAMRSLGGFRKTADEVIAGCRNVIRHNEGVIREQNRAMLETLFHECFHAFARNLLYTDKEIPRWLNEGMACYFEMSVMEAGELLHGAPNRDRMRLYRDMAAKGKLPRLEAVLRGTDFVVEHEGHIDRAVTAYSVSWALAHYACTAMTRDQMDGYVASVAAGADPADALVKALGQPLSSIDEAVRAHVASLK